MKNLFLACLVVVVVNIGIQSASAQIVPYKSVGSANTYDPWTGVFGGPGKTAHMGKSTGSGFAIPSRTDDPLVLDWVGEGVFVAANGDTIEFSGGGKVFLHPRADGLFEASWIGQFEIGDIDGDGKAGTGRFSNVGPGAEPLDVIAINDPFALDEEGNPLPGDIWTYDYEITGEMDLGKRKKK